MEVIVLLASIALIVLLTTKVNIHPFLALFVAALFFGVATGMPLNSITTALNDGFKETVGKTGLIILFGILIGAFLEKSGAAYVLTEKLLNLIGEKRIIPAMGIIGWIISIPVFCDSGFLLVSPLNKSLCRKAGVAVTGSAIALALGLISTHVMVPPTPGPVAAAGILGVDVGTMLLIGIPISALALIPSIIYANKIGNTDREAPPSTLEPIESLPHSPGPVRSSLPMVVPILLIVLRSVSASFQNYLSPNLMNVINFIGEPYFALFIGLVFALLLPYKLSGEMLSSDGWTGKALKDSAIIILITGAGGMFGKVLQLSNISELTAASIQTIHLGIWLPFVVAAILKTAQGSSTVAIITTASIISPLMISLGFVTPVEKALVAIMIGAGSAVVCHTNDSFFWVVTQLTEMPLKKSLRLFTPGTALVGFSAGIIIFITYFIIH